MTNIVLCGGGGTRLWPLSRNLMPKQFVKIFDDNSLFELTIKRNSKICDEFLVVLNSEHYFLVLDLISKFALDKNIKYLLEPVAKNTAPAIALACMALDRDEIVLVTPSDHLVKDEVEYKKSLQQAKVLADLGHLVTFGIVPSEVKTGFGYIEAKDENSQDVLRFHEKPDFITASKYIKTGKHYYNSGIFMFKAGVFLDELKKYALEIYNSSLNAFNNAEIRDYIRIKASDMHFIPENSIDYAVLEKSDNIKVVKTDMNWSDVGSFDALSDEFLKGENFNVKSQNYIALNSRNNFVLSKRKIATIGLENFIVIDDKDALLIAKKGETERVKDIVKILKDQNDDIVNVNLMGYRPWGTYEILEQQNGYKIKRIVVNPGCRLSLQKHLHRSEHWIVLDGTATIVDGGGGRESLGKMKVRI